MWQLKGFVFLQWSEFILTRLEFGVRGVLKFGGVLRALLDFGVVWWTREGFFCGVSDLKVGVVGIAVMPELNGDSYVVGLTAACCGTWVGVDAGVRGVATAAHLDFKFCTADINLLNSQSYKQC